MDKEIKKGIKKLLLADSLLVSASFISRLFDEVEDELDEMLGKPRVKTLNMEELLKIKTLK